MSKAYAQANAKKKKETSPKKASSPSVSQRKKASQNQKTYGNTEGKVERPNRQRQTYATAKQMTDPKEARRQESARNVSSTAKRFADERSRTSAQNQKTFGNTSGTVQKVDLPKKTAQQKAEDRATAQRVKSGIQTAEDERKIKERNEHRVEVAKNTGRAVKKGALDTVTGYGKTLADLDEMAKSTKKWSEAKSMKLGYAEDDIVNRAKVEGERQKSIKEARQFREDLGEKQDKRQEEFDELTKDATGFEKALYGAAESGTGMLMDQAVGMATGTGMFGSLASMGLRTYGTTRGQAEKEGATEAEDRLYALAQAGKEVGTELMFPGAGLAKGYALKSTGKAVGLPLAEKAAYALTKGLTGKKADIATAGLKLLGGTAEENAEELAGWGLDPLLKEAIYGRNVRQRTAEALRSNLPEVTSKEDADRVAAYFSTDKFENELTQEYIDSGLSKKEASELATEMRDYYVAYYSNDKEKLAELEDDLAQKLSGQEKLKPGSWSMDELMDTFASTTLLTMTTGLPGGISSSVRGNQMFDSPDSFLRQKFGDDAVKVVTDAVKNTSDPEMSARAQAMEDRLKSGKDLTGTQKYELAQGYMEKVRATSEKAQASSGVVLEEYKKNDYVATQGINANGERVYNKETQKAYDAEYQKASNTVDELKKSLSEDSDFRADAVKKAVADLHVGGLTVGDAHEFGYGNKLAREALKKELGVDLDKYVVRTKNGDIDYAATNDATENALFELNAKNAIDMAKVETDQYIDDRKGEIDTDLLSRFDSNAQAVWKDVNKDLDPHRDLKGYLATADAVSFFVSAGRNTEMSVDEIMNKYANVGMNKSIDDDILRQAVEAGRRDRIIANTAGYGQEVEEGQKIALKKTKPITTGELIIEKGLVIPDSDQQAYKALAMSTNTNIHLVSELVVNGTLINGMSHGNDIYLDVNRAAEQNLGYVFMHEMTHQIKQYAPNEYLALENLVRDRWFNKDAKGMEKEIKRRISLYSSKADQTLTEEEALEEIIADAMAEAIDDPSFASEVCESDVNLGQTIINSIRSALRSIRQMFANNEFRNKAFHNSLLSYLDILDDAEKMWLDALAVARENKANGLIADWQNKANKQNEKFGGEADVRFSITPQQDADYMAAVESGDMETAQRMVDEAATRAGYTERVYHGTYDFGTTEFEDIGLFTTNRVGTAREFAGGGNLRSIAGELDIDKASPQQLIDHINNNSGWEIDHIATEEDFKEELQRMAVPTDEIVKKYKLPKDIIERSKANLKALEGLYERFKSGETFFRSEFNAIGHSYGANSLIASRDEVIDVAKKYIGGKDNRGVYALALKPENMITIKGNGAYYTDIPIPKELQGSKDSLFDVENGNRKYAATDTLVWMASKSGYSTIKFEDIAEGGDYGYAGRSDVYVSMNPSKNVKSLDPVTYDNDGNVIPLSERFNQSNPDIRYSISEEQREELNAEGIEELDDGTTARYSMPSWEATNKDKKLKALVDAGHDEKASIKWINDINSISSIIASDPDRLDYIADRSNKFLKPNGDYYKYTLDASTLCDKRRIYQGTYDAIQHMLPDSPLMQDDVVRIRTLLKEMNHKAPCGICYVESQRKNLGDYAKQWYDSYARKDEIHLDDVTTTDGLKKLKETNPEVARDFEKAMAAKGVSSPKVVKLRTDYREDIMRMRPDTVKYLNDIGGLRFHSFSDFETPHLIDTMQAVMDMATKGLKGMAYAKVPNFAAVFGPTGIKINLSLIAKTDEEGNAVHDENGRLVFDSIEGIPYEEASKWRDAYPDDVAFILVGKDKQHTLEAINDDRVDFVIPFHRSKWSAEDMRRLGLVGYEDFATGHQENGIFVSQYWKYNKTGKENAEAYLKLCAKEGVTPVFEQLLVDNGDGSYSLQPDGSTDNYWKLLVEGKMYNHKTGKGAPQKLVEPNFNMEEARRVLGEYEGGANELPVAQDVVEAFVKEYVENHPDAKIADARLSISAKLDDDYMDAVNKNDMTKAQNLVDQAAEMAGMRVAHRWHGSMNANFTVFDKRKANVEGNSGAGFYFTTNEDDAINHYRDSEGADNYFKWTTLAEEIWNTGWTPEGTENVFETYEEVEQYAKEYLSKNPGVFDVYLNYKNPYVRNHRSGDYLNESDNSTNIYDMLMEGFDESVVDRDDYDDEDDYYDDVYFAKSDYIYEAVDDAVRWAYDYLEENYDYVDLPDRSKLIANITTYADDYDSITWDSIAKAIPVNAEVTLENDENIGNEVQWGSTELTRAIIEGFGYDAIQDKEVDQKFGQLSREMMTGTEHIIVFRPEQIKLSDPVTYAEDGSVIPLSQRFDPNNDDIRYSMPTQDTEGNILTDGQMEYFKNSKARDSLGRLVKVFHTTNNGGYTIFDPSYSDDKISFFFSDNFDVSQTYAKNANNRIDLNREREFLNDFIAEFYGRHDADETGLKKADWREFVLTVVARFYDTKTGESVMEAWEDPSDDVVSMTKRWLAQEDGTQDLYMDFYGGRYTFNNPSEFMEWAKGIVKEREDEYGIGIRYGETQRGYYEVYLNLENPLIVDAKGSDWENIVYDASGDMKSIYDDAVSIIHEVQTHWVNLDGRKQLEVKIDFSERDNEGWREPSVEAVVDSTDELLKLWTKLGFTEDQYNEIKSRYGTWDDEIDFTVNDRAFFYDKNGTELLYQDYQEGNTYSTRTLADYALSQGYDGVIIRNLLDTGGKNYSEEADVPSDIYIAFSSEQIKDVNNENPTTNPDIRYSVPDRQEAIDTMIAKADSIDIIPLSDPKLEEQRVKYSLSVKDFENMIISGWDEHYRTFGRLLDDESVKPHLIAMMSKIMDESETGRKYKTETLDETIKDMKVMYFEMKKGLSKDFADRAWTAAERIVDDIDFNDDLYVEYKGMRDYLEKRWIQIPEELMYDEDFAEYMRDNSGRMRFRENGNSVEAVYKYLRKKYPSLFTEDLNNPVDMLLQIDYVLDLTDPYRDAYSSEEYTELVQNVAETLCEMVRQGEEYRSVADDLYERFNRRTKAMKQRHREALAKVREQRDTKISEEKAKTQRQKDRANKWKEKYKQRIQHDKETRASKKERKMHRALYNSVLKEYNDLTKRLLNPSKDKLKNIPEQLRQPLAEMLYAFDLEKERSKELEEKYRIPTRSQLDFRKLKDSLEQVVREDETAYEFSDIHRFLKDKMTAIADKMDMLGDHSIDALDNNDIAVIKDLMKGLNKAIKDYQQFEIDGEKYQAQQVCDKIGEGAKEHESLYGKGKKYTGARAFIDNIVNMGELTPIYFFKSIKGLYDMYRQIRKGFDSYVRNEKVIIDKIADILAPYYKTNRKGQKVQGSEIEDWRHLESAETFNTTYGTLTLTIAQRMSLYCLYKRDQARNHMLSDRGGVVASEITAGSKIAKAEEMLKGKTVEYKQTPLTPEDVENIIATLTPEQMHIADELQKLMSDDMSKLGNQASMKLTGIEMYKEKEYFPIKIQSESKGKDLDNLGMKEKVRNPGFSNPLMENASNPIILDDIFTVVASHCNEMNLYASYAVPLTSFMKVYNGSVLDEDGKPVKVQAIIKQTYGEKAIQYIDNFLDDINGNSFKRHGGLDDVLDKALGQAKKASVFANMRVALQQPTAIVRAFAVMSPKYFKGVLPSKKATQEMFEHCPIAQWKSWGYYDTHFGRDIEDVMMGANVSSKTDYIMSEIYGEFDNMTWGMIWQAVKNEVKAENPKVQEGTQEFWDLCSERASYVFDMTQVVDSPFHRSNDMRSKNGLVKQLTSFQAEPTLSFNVLRQGFVDAYEEYKKGNKAKATQALERVLAVWTGQAVAVAIAQSFVDALRRKKTDDDDDDDPSFFTMWWMNFMNDFMDDLNPVNNVYYFKDIVPPILNALTGKYVFGQQNLTFQWVDTLTKGIQKCKKKWEKGEAYKTTWYDCLTDLFGGIGYLAGIPVKTMMRGVKNAVHWFNKIFGTDVFADDGSVDKAVDSMIDKFRPEKTEKKSKKKSSDEEDEEGLSKSDARKIFKAGIKEGQSAIPKTKEMLLSEIKEKTVGVYGEDREKKIWNIVGEGYKDYVEKGDYAYLNRLREVIRESGGDVNAFDQKVFNASKSAFKKTMISDPTNAQIIQQQNIRNYLLEHGMTEEEISSEIIYKSDTARDLKAAFRMGNEEYIVDELVTLLRAGVTRDDIYRLYKYRNYGAKDYDGKYSSPEYRQSTGTYVWPTAGTITSDFGYRNAPTAGASSYHQGIDIGAPQGTPVVACDGGTVIEAGANGGYGNSVGIRHDDGTISYYNHLYAWNVKVGDQVGQGQQIGQVGSTGISTGPHLDFRLYKDGEYMNPMEYLGKQS